MKYNKLVRDKIPEIIRQAGQTPVTHIANNAEYQQKLTEKLREELEEFVQKESEEELIDILEVIRAICEFQGIALDDLERLRTQKAEKRGSFSKRIILDGVE
jgi:predicted house-cleaning noncanonical NTP pyrophosphatase (MazG superfamily)